MITVNLIGAGSGVALASVQLSACPRIGEGVSHDGHVWEVTGVLHHTNGGFVTVVVSNPVGHFYVQRSRDGEIVYDRIEGKEIATRMAEILTTHHGETYVAKPERCSN